MNDQQLEQFMHRVLDGEATPAERDELMNAVNANPDVAEKWRTMQLAEQAFRGTGNVLEELLPPVQMPEGMTDLVMQKWHLEQPVPAKKAKKTVRMPVETATSASRPVFRFGRPFIQIGIAAAAIAFWVFVGGLLNPQEEIKSPETFMEQSEMTSNSNAPQSSGGTESILRSEGKENSLQSDEGQSQMSAVTATIPPEETVGGQREDESADLAITGQAFITADPEKPDSKKDVSNQRQALQTEKPAGKSGKQTVAGSSSNQAGAAAESEPSTGSGIASSAGSTSGNPTTDRSESEFDSQVQINRTPAEVVDIVQESAQMDAQASVEEKGVQSIKSAVPMAKPSAVSMSPGAAAAPVYSFDQNNRKAVLESGYLTVYDPEGNTILRESAVMDASSAVVEWKWSSTDRKLSVTYLLNEKNVTIRYYIP